MNWKVMKHGDFSIKMSTCANSNKVTPHLKAPFFLIVFGVKFNTKT